MFIGCDFTVGVQSTFESELFSTKACGKNRIFDMNNVLRAYACVGVFIYSQKFQKNSILMNAWILSIRATE
jgi:hypothetical protein